MYQQYIGDSPYISSLLNLATFSSEIYCVCNYLLSHEINPINPVLLAGGVLKSHNVDRYDQIKDDIYLDTFQKSIEFFATSLILLPEWKKFKSTYGVEYLTAVKKRIPVLSINTELVKQNAPFCSVLKFEYIPALKR